MAWRSSGTNNTEMVDKLKRKNPYLLPRWTLCVVSWWTCAHVVCKWNKHIHRELDPIDCIRVIMYLECRAAHIMWAAPCPRLTCMPNPSMADTLSTDQVMASAAATGTSILGMPPSMQSHSCPTLRSRPHTSRVLSLYIRTSLQSPHHWHDTWYVQFHLLWVIIGLHRLLLSYAFCNTILY